MIYLISALPDDPLDLMILMIHLIPLPDVLHFLILALPLGICRRTIRTPAILMIHLILPLIQKNHSHSSNPGLPLDPALPLDPDDLSTYITCFENLTHKPVLAGAVPR
jgi:hypothetical protein